MPGLTRSQLLVGGAGVVALPRLRRTPAPLAALKAAMRGPVLLPGTPAYARAAPVYNARYDYVRPAAVAMPLDPGDLAAGLKVARARHIPFRIRSGGHSYIGASTVAGGVIFDLRRLSGIKLLSDGTVLAGAGLMQIQLIDALARRGRKIVHGSCPTVGVGGFTLGGGYGFDARLHGLACDNLVSARAIDLRTLKPASADGDLMHALRGAGSSMAPVTSMRLKTHPLGNVTTFFANYPWSRAAEILRAFVARAPAAPGQLASICNIATGSGTPTVEVFGQYLGTGAAATRAINRLLPPGASLTKNEHTYVQAQLIFAGCLGKTVAQCRPQSQGGTLPRATFVAGSAYIAKTFGAAGASRVIDFMEARQTAGGSGVLLFDAQGGAIDNVSPSQSAFIHRNMRSSVQIASYYSGGASALAGARNFVAGARTALAPIATGQAYQNYPDADMTTWRTAYYGNTYSDLVAFKQERDPYGLLRFPQSIGS